MLVAPRYGSASLSDLIPSILGALGVPGAHDRIGLPLDGVRRVCVLLVDGLGSQLLRARADAAPFLAALPETVLTAGFPSTTATSLSSLGTGLTPGQHGIVGYLFAVPGHERLMTPLKWRLHGPGDKIDLLKEIVPEDFQPLDTALQRAAAANIAVTRVAPMYQAASGLSRASLRGGGFRPNFSMGDLVDGVTSALAQGDRALVYAYHAELDMTGHVRGPQSDAWALELSQVDHMVAAIAARLTPDAALIVTADHGMVTVDAPVDFDTNAHLHDGVDRVGGEPRARHVYTVDGAEADVAATWRAVLGNGYAVHTRAELVAAGWFGPDVTPTALPRIGNVMAVATGSGAITRSGVEPLQSALVGHHGSLTAAEMNIPLLVARG